MKTSHRAAALLGLMLVAFGFTGATCQQGREVAKTVNDAARIACLAAFGAEAPQGFSAEDLCRTQQQLQPFLDAILGARRDVAEGLKAAPPQTTAGP